MTNNILLLAFTCLISLSLADCDGDCKYCLSNSDFEDGTVRIRKSGKYCLSENIVFDPRPGDIDSPNDFGDWFPINDREFPGSIDHDDGGWALGFFAAITIETGNVELDLNGKEMKQSKAFYIQQRFFNLIEIQNAPFNFGQGPANFGQEVSWIKDVYIHNGALGLSSHNGIHAFNCENVVVEDIDVYDFEVCGVQFNGFNDVVVRNLNIGPSSTEVPFWGYYSHGRFALNGFDLIDDLDRKYVDFQGGRRLTLKQIYYNLRDALDIAFRYEIGETTDSDEDHPDYMLIKELFVNPNRVPDGSAIYGMLFNSWGLATQGFGAARNEDYKDGSNLRIENVKVMGLKINVNEIPTLAFDECDGYYYTETGERSITPVLDRFGGSFDARKSLKYDDWDEIDRGFGNDNNGYSYNDVYYYGNPLSDAQVALDLFSAVHKAYWPQGDGDQNRGKEWFRGWATTQYKNDGLPGCAKFICNGDAMFHTNKGLVGVRIDGIEHTHIDGLEVTGLTNESPLCSNACGSYRGPEDGVAQPGTLEREGCMMSDIRGIAAIDCGDIDVYGNLHLSDFESHNGDVIGLHLMDDVKLYFDKDYDNHLFTDDFDFGTRLDYEHYDYLQDRNEIPYPNNIYKCNIKAEQLKDRKYGTYPYDRSHSSTDKDDYFWPHDAVEEPECYEFYE